MNVFAALLIAAHAAGPYDWHMSCERWKERAVEIMADEKISIHQRRFLVRYLRNKVQGDCPVDWSQLLQ